MTNMVLHLYPKIEKCLKGAKSVFVAVASTSSFGIETISIVSSKCLVRVVSGVNLPTPI